jgi:hypothetical protein
MLNDQEVLKACDELCADAADTTEAAAIIAAARGWSEAEVFEILYAEELADFIAIGKPVQ